MVDTAVYGTNGQGESEEMDRGTANRLAWSLSSLFGYRDVAVQSFGPKEGKRLVVGGFLGGRLHTFTSVEDARVALFE